MYGPDTPSYLEAEPNEDSGAYCKYCDDPAYDDGPYPDLCIACTDEALFEEACDRRADEAWDRQWD